MPQSYYWEPISDLPDNWRLLSDPQAHVVMKAWQEQAETLQKSHKYEKFLTELRRQWAIETGALERLYSISDGATKTLIEKGLDAALISHDDTDKPIGDVLDLIRDQHTAIQGLYTFIANERQMSTSYIRELHQIITTHQNTYDARDTLGNVVYPAMVRGDWKKWPNNVTGPDDFVFEFCPPEQVALEMERLVAMHQQHTQMGVPPEVEAAWLHHRFTLIHPFVDGNGRVARCLATLIFLKERWFPLVITRKDKTNYIETLRKADQGDLMPFILFLSDLQRKAVRQAWSLSEEIADVTTGIEGVLTAVNRKFTVRKQEKEQRFKQAITMADTLFSLAKEIMDDMAQQVKKVIESEDPSYQVRLVEAPRSDERASYNRWQIIQCAKELDYYANLQDFPSWIAMQIDTGVKIEVLVSFHGVGREWTGILACTVMAYRKEIVDVESGKKEATDLKVLSEAPFEITFTDESVEINARFRKWLEDRLLLGLNYWQQSI